MSMSNNSQKGVNAPQSVGIEEVWVNMDYVKEEPEEDVWNYEVNHCKAILTVESTDGGNNESNETKIKVEQLNLISSLENNGVFEEKIKSDLNEDHFYCNKCSADYRGFCSKCLILTHLLNNDIPRTNPEWKTKTISTDNLEIRGTFDKQGVFALKNIPENVMLGPFEGVSPIKNSDEFIWTIKDGNLLNLQNGNWMQYINCVTIASANNLDVFQFEGNLFYQTNREIGEGEELLVYYKEKDIQKSENNEVRHFNPMLVTKSQEVFVCIQCCLGFKLKECLIKHKQKCPHAVHNRNIPEIIQCCCCNIWLEGQEYLEHDVSCRENSSRLCKYPAGIDRSKGRVSSSSSTQILSRHSGGVEKVHKCEKCCYQTNLKRNFTRHICKDIVGMEKRHKCTKCSYEAKYKSGLAKHILSKHNEESEKLHKCTECSYETNFKTNFTMHVMNKHTLGTDKRHKCTDCPFQTNYKNDLTMHIMNKHAVGMDKRHKCTECSYQTNIKIHLTEHIMNKHAVGMEKRYKCTECLYETNFKTNFTMHVMNKHTVGIEKRHKCTECSFQTNYKNVLTMHINNKHSLELEKRHKCTQCPYETNIRNHFEVHVLNMHTVEMEKRHKCTECTYETNNKSCLTRHTMLKHSEGMEKRFKCTECSYQTNLTSSLTVHIMSTHAVGTEKLHKCTECSYQTNIKYNLTSHIMNKHTVGVEKRHKCHECSFETNYKNDLTRHLRTHGPGLNKMELMYIGHLEYEEDQKE